MTGCAKKKKKKNIPFTNNKKKTMQGNPVVGDACFALRWYISSCPELGTFSPGF